MPDYIYQWLNQTWIILVAVIGGVSLVWKFKGTLKEITEEIKKPVSEINSKLDAMDVDNKLERAALLSLQRKSLLDSCQFYLHRGFASLEEKSTMNEQYASYHELGGNSFITDIVHQVQDLPIEKEVKKKSKRVLNENK